MAIFTKNIHLIRVAIFDDNKQLRETFALLLNNADDFACAGAYPHCDHFVTHLEINPADIVLMDIEMPGMNGIEATKLVKAFSAIRAVQLSN